MTNTIVKYLGKYVTVTEEVCGQVIQSEGQCVGVIQYLEEPDELLLQLANGDRESVGIDRIQEVRG